MPYAPCPQCALVLYVLRGQSALVSHTSHTPRALCFTCLVPYVLSCLTCLVRQYMLLHPTCLKLHVLSYPACLESYVLLCLMCLMSFMLLYLMYIVSPHTWCLTCLVSYVPSFFIRPYTIVPRNLSTACAKITFSALEFPCLMLLFSAHFLLLIFFEQINIVCKYSNTLN